VPRQRRGSRRAAQLVARVLVQAREHAEVVLVDAEALAGRGLQAAQQALVEQRLHRVHHRRRVGPGSATTASAAASVKPPSNTEHWAKVACSAGVQQLPRPVDRGAQRASPPRRVSGLPSTAKRSRRRSAELLGGQQLRAGRGELDRERQPVEEANHLGDLPALARVGDEPVLLRTRDEQLDRRVVERQRARGPAPLRRRASGARGS
jgi:hypothetical protein